MFALDHVESTDARAYMDANAFGIFRRNLEPRHLHRFIRSGDRKVDETPHLLHFFFFDELKRVEVANLIGNLAGKSGRVEPGDAVDTALAGKQRLPHRSSGVADGADQADAGNHDPSCRITSQI